MGRALWLPDLIRGYGVPVIEVDGWRERGSATFDPQVIVCHHTANPNRADAPSLGLVIRGRADLPGPLCQVLLSRSGIAYIVASGRANHAGAGGWKGVSGNTKALGIEAENDGVGEPWPQAQLESYLRIAAAMCDGTIPMRGTEWVCGHKEWAPSRKVDPRGIDMNWFRGKCARRRDEHHHNGGQPAPVPTPQPPPTPPPHSHSTPMVKFDTSPFDAKVHGAVWHTETNPDKWFWQRSYSEVYWEVRDVQQHLANQGHRIAVDGIGGPDTRNQVIAYQRHRGLVGDAVVGPATWARLHG
jgi:N-acetyl-anhydromuramyl-L-alanine amidase AmpD